LMDVQMPEMDGLAATELLREREKTTGGHTYVIGVTAHATSDDRASCLKAGMDAFISKPYRAATLLGAIKGAGQSRGSGFDEAEALTRTRGDRALLEDLVRIFLEDCPQHVQDLRDAIEREDPSSVRYAAHTLKGSMSNFVRVRRGDAVQQLEHMGREKELSLAKRTFSAFERQIEALTLELNDWLVRGTK